MKDSEKKIKKNIKAYSKMYYDTLKKKGFSDLKIKKEEYIAKLNEMYHSDLYDKHNIYPSISMDKVYAVIAMCLLLKKDNLNNDEIIDFVNYAFRKGKKIFGAIERVIDIFPCTYKIVKKWNINDHANRVKDKSIEYDDFQADDNHIEYKITKCMYVEVFKDYGIKELCKIFCITDEQAYANLKRHVQFIRHSDLASGDCCYDEILKK